MAWAHSGTPGDRSDWQPLADHLRGVSSLAGRMGEPLALGRAAALAGLLHDLGKYDPRFQRYIAGDGPGVDHSTAGGAILMARAMGADRQVAELLSYAILGHHAGLPDRGLGEEGGPGLDGRVEAWRDGLDPAWEREVRPDLAGIGAEIMGKVRREHLAFDLSLAVRMVFSCLVDADFKDTEAFYARLGRGPAPDRDWPALPAILPGLAARFDAHMADMATEAKDGELNRLRREVLAHVRGKAGGEPGIFTLTVPTGGGKTLASLGFALDHARARGLRRIVYAIPFTSIIDQTSDIFRRVLGDGHVLEHHSALDEDKVRDKGERAGRDKLRLAMEDWAAPVVVTTNVQLFESLFAARPSRARKLHNLANSVIVLDEAQAIPRPLLEPCVRAIDALARHYGCTVVLCTATQPAFERGRLALPVRAELAPDPKGLAGRLRRARVARTGAMDDAALVAALGGHPQALVIVNSRAHALALFRAARGSGLDGLVHLTTRQCAAHRRAVLAEVRRRLTDGEPCRVVATSLVEAGVDLDFPRVWRAEAGLDSIVQAAGRCNREGRRPVEDSVVTVFEAAECRPPTEVAELVADMGRMVDRHADLLSLEAIEDYFGEVYWRLGDRLDGRTKEKAIMPRLAVSRAGTDFAFRSIAADFRMVDDAMAPVVVPWDEAAREAVRQLGVEAIPSGRLARALQPYVVQVPPPAQEALIRNGHVRRERADQFAVLANMGFYNDAVGLEWERADELPVAGGIV